MPELSASDFAFVEELHRSSGGSVFLGRDRRTGTHVILKERLKPELGRGSSISHELELYAQLPRHRHLIACLGHFWRGSGATGAPAGRSSEEIGRGDDRSRSLVRNSKANLVLVLEHAPLGDLHEFLQSRRSADGDGFLDESLIWQILAQVASAVSHLHANSIVHRDLKALNIVLCAEDADSASQTAARNSGWEPSQHQRRQAVVRADSKDGKTYRGVPLHSLVAKICDLGVSRSRSDDTVYMQTFCGTPAYLAPELVGSQPYTERADLWSLGVILYELTALQLPFHGRDLREVSELIAKGKFAPLPARYSSSLSALISSMLQLDLAKRPSAKRVLEIARANLSQQREGPASGLEMETMLDAESEAKETSSNSRRYDAHASPAFAGETVVEPTLAYATMSAIPVSAVPLGGEAPAKRSEVAVGYGHAVGDRRQNACAAHDEKPRVSQQASKPFHSNGGVASDEQRRQMAAQAIAAAADTAAKAASAEASINSREAIYERKRLEFLARHEAEDSSSAVNGDMSSTPNGVGNHHSLNGMARRDGRDSGVVRRADVATRQCNAASDRRSGDDGMASATPTSVPWQADRETSSSVRSDASVLSARDARLAQRMRERERDQSSRPSTRGSSRPPSAPGIPLARDDARAISERQAQAYVLAQQMVAMHAADKNRVRPALKARDEAEALQTGPCVPFRPSSAQHAPNGALGSRPGSGRPGSAALRGGAAAEGYDLITGAPLQSWRIR